MPKKTRYILIAAAASIFLVGFILWMVFFGSSETNDGGLRAIFPFGQSPDDNPSRPTTNKPGSGLSNTPLEGGAEEERPLPKLILITDASIAGAFGIARKTEAASTAPIVRYVERITGHVFEVDLAKNVATRLTNTSIPKIHEVYWTNNGNAVILRYLRSGSDNIQTYYAKIQPPPEGESAGSLVGTFLPGGITSLTVSPATDRIAYLRTNETGSVVYISDPDGGKAKELVRFPAREFIAQWPAETLLMLTTKPSAEAYGYAFGVHTTSGAYRRNMGDALGLSVLANTQGDVLLTGKSDGQTGYSLSAANRTGSPDIQTLDVRTLPEKCIWSNIAERTVYCAVPAQMHPAEYPDDWYKGTAVFADAIWKINIATGEKMLVVNPRDYYDVFLNMINLVLDPEERFLYFTNKDNGSLWAVRL